MPKQHLSDRFIKTLRSPEKRIEYYDQHLIDPQTHTLKRKGVKGLLLRVTQAGSKYFYYLYWYDGKAKKYKIGDYPNLSLSDARDKARELAGKVNEGIDPQAEKNRSKYKPKEMSFQELADIFSKRHLPTLKKRTADEYQRIIDIELLGKDPKKIKSKNGKKGPNWKGLSVSQITSQHVRELLNHKAYKEDSFTMANRIRSTISKIFEFGLEHVGLNIDKNPVENTPVFKQGENVRDRVYNEDELKELWEYWQTVPEPIQSYYKFLLLTGQRRTETLRMKWTDIQEDKPCKRLVIGTDGRSKPEAFLADIWTIPAEEVKNNQAHEVPLSDIVKELLEKLKPVTGNSDYVFASPRAKNRPLTNVKRHTKSIKKETSISDFRLHDLRRTVATKLEESLVDEIVIKKILNHKSEGVTGRHYTWYTYTDKKLEALQRWGWRLQAIISGEAQTKAKITKIGS